MSTPIVPTKPPLPGLTPQADAPDDGEAKIVKLPAALLEVRQKVQLEGRVVQSSPDGAVRIRTERGDIDVKIPKGQAPPVEGERVEINIPPGRPPQNAEVKSAPPRETPAPPPPRASETPVSVDVREPPRTKAPEAAQVHDPSVPVKTLPAQELVQLKPVAPESLPQLPPEEILTQAVSSVPARAEFRAQLIASAAIDQIAAQVLKSAPAAPQSPATISVYEALVPPPKAGAMSAQAQPAIPVPASVIRETVFPLTSPVLTPKLNLETPQGIRIDAPQKPIPGAVSTALPDAALLSQGFEALPVTKPELIFFTRPLEIIVQKVTDIIRAQVSVIDTPGINIPAVAKETVPGLTPPSIPGSAQDAAKPLILQNTQAQALSAVVIGQTPEKFPVVSVFIPALGQEKFFALQIPVENIAIGTRLSLVPQTPPGAPLPPGNILANIVTPPAPLPLSFITPEPWPLLQDIEQVMAQVMPAAAQAMLNVTPSPVSPMNFGPAALFFIAALRGGDLSQWLGERGVETLRRAGRSDLLSRLGQESNALNRLASEPVSQDWRALSVPLAWQDEIHKMALFYKQDSSGGEDKGERGKQTRFIFDLKLDQMGAVQLDGLFRTARLDVILRTQEVLSQNMQMAMRRAYTNALESAGVGGEISFQSKPEQWVTINPDNRKLMGASA